jgi:ADP-ribose pyrophosphatase YjhB (NUDIX family)
MAREPSPQVREKVYAYITQGDQLLVFRHVDFPDAGIQVPGGTVQSGEFLRDAVVREAFKETGLAELEIVAELGETWFAMHDFERPEQIHHRHFFHVRAATVLPATWRHEERDPADGGPPILFEFFWIPLKEAPLLIANMGALAYLIGLRSRRSGVSGKLPDPGGQQ